MAIPTPDTKLSANDTRILNALFDPETLPSSVAKARDISTIDSTLPSHPTIPQSELSTLETQQNEIVSKVSSTSPSAQEDQTTIIDSSLSTLDEIIQSCPKYPSAYLNRAMVQRMKLENTITDTTPQKSFFTSQESSEPINSLFKDLSQAIQLSMPSTPSSPVSPYQARILRTAHSHRAYLYLKASESGQEWDGKGKAELEELASGDFSAAARYGDEVAREMSVRTNPYAKMCGAIVRNALAEERREAAQFSSL
ncbi:hypothetical protein BU24DRAFT_202521 [Aaosphaeria arxii CBS 175.79]|uniref:Uncharacterized protein n=1 Tax=Aaosphaeria arxii CBS 175.79 TaxID=1450172 RepID=A0A6A5XU78_9PLEO|nr:uncharacterized protein BU24DRAFT_202521 [Aaosphaeria arxii CBS 175.79]KAF2016476.1 hypothetical protein BU24DRAFT_202521 [Aaosphaeria arxii CBS 175.79]